MALGILRSSVPVAVAAALWTGCATNPVTGERGLSLVSESQEVEIGRQAAEDVEQTIGIVNDPGLQKYVSGIGQQIASRSERPSLPWRFQVVDDPTPNAFALPGGFIYITRGMMGLLTSEAELASVLGHEVAHVTARHSVQQISQQQLAQIGLGLGSIFFPEVEKASPLIGAGLQLLFLKHSRDDERQADEIGFRYVNEGGYDVNEFADVFATLERVGDEGGSLPNWLATHPSPAERVETAQQRAAKLPAEGRRVGRDVYLREIEGMPFGEDPRQGFFKGTTFYHPDMRFQIQFPRGWQTRNLAQAVVGSAPNGSAAFELSLSRANNVRTAYQEFARQNGVSAQSPSSGRIQGLSAVSGEFTAQTEGGPLRGVIAFIEHGGRVFQLAGYGTNNGFRSAASALESTIESFGAVRDQAILNVETPRIDIVEVDRATTLGEFAERYPSVISVEQLALINQVQNASTRIAAGTLVKRVVS